jgi:hypothetical protein
MIRLRLANDGAFAQPSQTEPEPLVEVVETRRGPWRHGSRLPEMLNDMSLFTKNRDHVLIVPQLLSLFPALFPFSLFPFPFSLFPCTVRSTF